MMSGLVKKRPSIRWKPWCQRQVNSWYRVLCHGNGTVSSRHAFLMQGRPSLLSQRLRLFGRVKW